MAGGSGKTVEQVAREIATAFFAGASLDHIVNHDRLTTAISRSLRQREQETAAVCAALVAAAGKANDFGDSNWAFQQIIEELVEAILSRFPKDQG